MLIQGISIQLKLQPITPIKKVFIIATDAEDSGMCVLSILCDEKCSD